jgi:polyhydroxyalkanoate synthesis regulator phasin
MLTKKSLLITGAVTTIGVAGAAGMNTAFAYHNTNNDDLVTKLAQKFNLSEEEVRAVFDDYKSDKQEAKVSAYLQKLVDKGKITAEQKTVIETKLVDVRANVEAEQDALDAWAEAQGIDASFVFKYNLDELVDDGQITEAQKTAIEAKRDELRQKHQAARDELKQWAKDNDINLKYLMMDRGYFDYKNDHGFKHHDKGESDNKSNQ